MAHQASLKAFPQKRALLDNDKAPQRLRSVCGGVADFTWRFANGRPQRQGVSVGTVT
jgi:3-methyladenine DNA glycosylase Tag